MEPAEYNYVIGKNHVPVSLTDTTEEGSLPNHDHPEYNTNAIFFSPDLHLNKTDNNVTFHICFYPTGTKQFLFPKCEQSYK